MNINETVNFWNGCEISEVLAIITISFLIPLPLALLMPLSLVFIISILVMIIGFVFGTKYLQKVKRNKQKNYFQKKISIIIGVTKNFKKYNTYSRL